MVTHQTIRLPAKSYGVHLITTELLHSIHLKGEGLLHLLIQHTSAALALNENASSDVLRDTEDFFNQLVPQHGNYLHSEEGPDDMPAHIKSIICGSSLTIPFKDNRLMLGTWQGIYLMEFRFKAGARTIVASQLS